MKKKIHLTIFLVVTIIAIIAALVPVVWASRYAYPWGDDFSYGATAHLAFRDTGSFFKAVQSAFAEMIHTYFTWQGTYTSCFLMALHPGVFSIKLYHFTGVLMLASIFAANYILFHNVLHKVFGMSGTVTLLLSLLTTFISIEGVDGKAEAFTWFNSAVHYTFGHDLLIVFLGLTFGYMMRSSQKRSLLSCVLISVLGFLAAGVNNITVFGGLLTILIFLGCAFLYFLIWEDRKFQKVLSILPMAIVYTIGTVVNLTSVGNKGRMSLVTTQPNSLFFTVKNSFQLGACFIQRHFSLVTLAFMIISVVLMWYGITREEILKDIDFKFPLPGLITVISFCIISALYAPSTYLSDLPEGTIAFIDGNLGVHRIANCVYFAYVLLLLLNVFYYCGWIYKKGFTFHNSVIGSVVVCACLIMAFFSCRSQINEEPGVFLTSAAIYDLQNDTAQYYGYQMAINFQALETDEPIVTVAPIAVDPDILFPHDAVDWKEGALLFYDKKVINYDHEPYF